MNVNLIRDILKTIMQIWEYLVEEEDLCFSSEESKDISKKTRKLPKEAIKESEAVKIICNDLRF